MSMEPFWFEKLFVSHLQQGRPLNRQSVQCFMWTTPSADSSKEIVAVSSHKDR